MSSSRPPAPGSASPEAIRAECPDCDARFRVRAATGTAVTCPKCGAPFVLRARVPREPAAPADVPAPRGPSASARRGADDADPATGGGDQASGDAGSPTAGGTVPWLKVALTVVALAVAHIGVYQLLTSSDRGEMRAMEAEHGGRPPTSAMNPGPPPASGTPAYRTWLGAKRLHEDGQRYADLGSKVGASRSWLLMAFVIQIGLLGFALMRTAAKVKRRRAPTRRARSS